MNALDTNVLVRFLVRDDERQHRRAAAFIEAAATPLFVSEIVLCELAWVLRYSYKVRKTVLVGTLRQLVHSRQLRFAAREGMARAIDAYEAGRGDFADYVIREQARSAGAEAVVTFDGALADEDGFAAP